MAFDPWGGQPSILEQLRGLVPDQWLTELARYGVYYQTAYVNAYLAGDFATANQVLAAARAAPWQINSAGLIYPAQDWFYNLSPEDQAMHVARLNDPTLVQRQIAELNQAAAQAAQQGDTARAQQLMTEANQLKAMAAQYQQDYAAASAYLSSTNNPDTGAPPPGAGGGTTPPPGGVAPPGDTGVAGDVDQGKYSQAVDETARADPASFVAWVLSQNGGDPYGSNPLAASALRKASLTPYMRLLHAGGNPDNAALYTFGDYLENWTKNNNAPGVAGGGNGTAMSFAGGTNALRGLVDRATNPDRLEYAEMAGDTPQDSANNLKTYFAAAYADSLDPIAQQAAQKYIDMKQQDYMNSIYSTGDAGTSFLDYFKQHGFNYA